MLRQLGRIITKAFNLNIRNWTKKGQATLQRVPHERYAERKQFVESIHFADPPSI